MAKSPPAPDAKPDPDAIPFVGEITYPTKILYRLPVGAQFHVGEHPDFIPVHPYRLLFLNDQGTVKTAPPQCAGALSFCVPRDPLSCAPRAGFAGARAPRD